MAIHHLEHTEHFHHTEIFRSNAMNVMYEDLARAQMSQRLAEAHSQRRGHRVAVNRRLSRRAERAAQAARLAAARV